MENIDIIFKAITEALDALGDIPDDVATDQQREAYRLCKEVHDYMFQNLEDDFED